MTISNFTRVVDADIGIGGGLFASVVAVAFAYEGWIIATSINSELIDAKRNLPKALIWGSLIVVFVYICYYIGLAGAVSTEALMASGVQGPRWRFKYLWLSWRIINFCVCDNFLPGHTKWTDGWLYRGCIPRRTEQRTAAGDFQAGGQGYQYAYKFLSFGLLLCLLAALLLWCQFNKALVWSLCL